MASGTCSAVLYVACGMKGSVVVLCVWGGGRQCGCADGVRRSEAGNPDARRMPGSTVLLDLGRP